MVAEDNDAIIMSIVSSDAEVVATNLAHAAWLGRTIDDVVGHNCREWCAPASWDQSWANLQQAVTTGHVIGWERTIVRPDGTAASGRVIARPLKMKGRRSLVLCTVYSHQAVTSQSNSGAVQDAINLASYVEQLSQSLAEMASHRGLLTLAEGLEQVVAEAADAAKRLEEALHQPSV